MPTLQIRSNETQRVIAKKSAHNINDLRNLVKTAKLRIVPNPSEKILRANLYLIDDPKDVPILRAAMKARVDYLVTHDRRHFLEDPKIAEKSGLRIGAPGDALSWLRAQF